jgi:hypothetical protein
MPRKKTDLSFEEFWKLYPLHKAKGSAERAWNRISDKNKRAALAAIPRYREYCEQHGIAFKYPQGWLNDQRWTDEYPEENTSQHSDAEALASMEVW